MGVACEGNQPGHQTGITDVATRYHVAVVFREVDEVVNNRDYAGTQPECAQIGEKDYTICPLPMGTISSTDCS